MILRYGTYYQADKIIEICCADCGKMFRIPATPEQYNRIVRGSEAIQDILPNTTAEEREMFVTGWCNDCFPSDPDEDD